jgi:hypothetical protein
VSTQLTPCVRGYGIFPGKFRDVIDPNSPAWTDTNYNPVAPTGDPDAKTGLGTSAITVELGSLYYGDANIPYKNGMLFRLEVIPAKFGARKGNLTLAVNTTRGGVVDINGDSFVKDVNLTLTGCEVNYPDCFPCWPPCGAAAASQYAEWLTVFNPDCWCAQGSTASSGVFFNWRTQCWGDADGKYQTVSRFRVYTSDYAKLMSCWGKKATSMVYDPNCICADFDHKYQTVSRFRVYTSDYTRLMSGWGKKETVLRPSPPYGWCPREQ